MLIVIYSVIAALIFVILRKRIDFRQYYSSLLMMSYLRFLAQYIFVHILEVWEYQKLPLPVSKVISVPVTLDITIFPLLALFFIKFVPVKPLKTLVYYLGFPLIFLGLEASLVFWGFLKHHEEWNFLFSYYLSFSTLLVVHWQYKLFLKTGWYSIKSKKTG